MKEFHRKLFHLLCIVYGILYAALARRTCLQIMAVLGLLVLLVEGARLRVPAFNRWSWERFGPIARNWEKNGLTGIFWTWLGSFLTMLIFVRRDIVLAALGFMIFGDAAAALAGKAWGRHAWPGRPGKSMEGTLAFAIAATAWGLWFLPPPVVVIAALAAAGAESYRLPWDDNLWIPLIAGACLSLVRLH